MELKEYQQRSLATVKQYLDLLAEERGDGNVRHASMDAWNALGIKQPYRERQNGLGKDLPNFCLKVPTGGGKTLLAVKTLDLINTTYRKKRTGLVLWVVPTTQIYRQTLRALNTRDHPYRQHLDNASGGRTLIREKMDHFTPEDVTENLVVLMLMLPSASRQTKETLKVFKDNGFQDFFPAEDDRVAQEALLKKVPNLDCFTDDAGFWGKQVKTSLGNVLRLLEPVIIMDEGHKAYSHIAQDTLHGLNPSMLVELSATPPEESNKLVDIAGLELLREEMIKLDLHITNKASTDWKDTLLATKSKRDVLEKAAQQYEENTSTYIRPIAIIQVERTGREQRSEKWIHSEDVREHLIKVLGIPPEQIAVKTSEKDELKEVDDAGGLTDRNCQIRYIITKQALQEGWDCAFAYVLAILTNPSSKNALTQLVGRILRQPYARKTGVPALDESYVFCFQQRGEELLKKVRQGLEGEGLGDLASRVAAGDDDESETSSNKRVANVRSEFKKAAQQTVLPIFVVKGNSHWRKVDFEADIAHLVPWNDVNLEPLFNLVLNEKEDKDKEYIETLSENKSELIKQRDVLQLREGGLKLDAVFMTRHLYDIVPNPWVAFEQGKQVLSALLKRNNERLVANNFVFVIEETRKYLAKERDRLAERVFRQQLDNGKIRFLVIGDKVGYRFHKKRTEESVKWLTKEDSTPLQKSLFDFVPSEGLNETEQQVAWYMDEQAKLLFWFRNVARVDYAIQGWRKNKIYPDFIVGARDDDNARVVDRVYVVETKGKHLLGSDDTEYKERVFDVCNKMAKKRRWGELGMNNTDIKLQFELVPEDEWQARLNEMIK
ncbi:MAG: DEAD/DEAH box helicase family protein [bacterium]|nr:DEAD/DEAH box helicase family protein [bacterium]